MSDDQDTTAPGKANVTISRVEVACDDPDRFIHSLNKAVARELEAPPVRICPRCDRQFPQYGIFAAFEGRHFCRRQCASEFAAAVRAQPWRRIKRYARAVPAYLAWGCVTSLAILGACWLLGVPRP